MKKKNEVLRTAILMLSLTGLTIVVVVGTFAKYSAQYVGTDTAMVARFKFEGFLGQEDDEQEQVLSFFGHAYDKHVNQLGYRDVGSGGDYNLVDGEYVPAEPGQGSWVKSYIIAPGVGGAFLVEMSYLADVDAEIIVEFAEAPPRYQSNGEYVNLPMRYSLDGDTWVELKDLGAKFLEELVSGSDWTVGVLTPPAPPSDSSLWKNYSTAAFSLSGTDYDEAFSLKIPVLWKWPYEYEKTLGDYEDEGTYNLHKHEWDKSDTMFSDWADTGYSLKITVTANQVIPD